MRQCMWRRTLELRGTQPGRFGHRPLRAKPVSREEKLSVKVVWRV